MLGVTSRDNEQFCCLFCRGQPLGGVACTIHLPWAHSQASTQGHPDSWCNRLSSHNLSLLRKVQKVIHWLYASVAVDTLIDSCQFVYSAHNHFLIRVFIVLF